MRDQMHLCGFCSCWTPTAADSPSPGAVQCPEGAICKPPFAGELRMTHLPPICQVLFSWYKAFWGRGSLRWTGKKKTTPQKDTCPQPDTRHHLGPSVWWEWSKGGLKGGNSGDERKQKGEVCMILHLLCVNISAARTKHRLVGANISHTD